MLNTVAAQAPRTLIADDQPDVLAALRLLLKGAGYQTEAADSPAAVLNAIRHEKFDLLLMDLNYARDTTSGKEGLDLISRIQALDHDLPIVVMTAWATVDLAVESMRLGVRDFVQKPWENSRLLRKLKTQIDYGRLQRDREAATGMGERSERRRQWEVMRREDRHERQRSNDLTVRPTSKLTPVRRPSPSLVLPRRRATRCRARRRCEPSGGSASWPGGRRCNQAGDRSQSRRR